MEDSQSHELALCISRRARASAHLVVGGGRSNSPAHQHLVAQLGESVSLNVLTDDGDVLTIDQVAGPSELTTFNWLGQRSPVQATAAGKVLLAQMSDDQVDALLPDELTPLTECTPDRASLLKEVSTARSCGYATSRDELEIGLSAFAAPVFDSMGLVAALTASGPTPRLFGDRCHQIVAEVVEAAGELSARLGALVVDS